MPDATHQNAPLLKGVVVGLVALLCAALLVIAGVVRWAYALPLGLAGLALVASAAVHAWEVRSCDDTCTVDCGMRRG